MASDERKSTDDISASSLVLHSNAETDSKAMRSHLKELCLDCILNILSFVSPYDKYHNCRFVYRNWYYLMTYYNTNQMPTRQLLQLFPNKYDHIINSPFFYSQNSKSIHHSTIPIFAMDDIDIADQTNTISSNTEHGIILAALGIGLLFNNKFHLLVTTKPNRETRLWSLQTSGPEYAQSAALLENRIQQLAIERDGHRQAIIEFEEYCRRGLNPSFANGNISGELEFNASQKQLYKGFQTKGLDSDDDDDNKSEFKSDGSGSDTELSDSDFSSSECDMTPPPSSSIHIDRDIRMRSIDIVNDMRQFSPIKHDMIDVKRNQKLGRLFENQWLQKCIDSAIIARQTAAKIASEALSKVNQMIAMKHNIGDNTNDIVGWAQIADDIDDLVCEAKALEERYEYRQDVENRVRTFLHHKRVSLGQTPIVESNTDDSGGVSGDLRTYHEIDFPKKPDTPKHIASKLKEAYDYAEPPFEPDPDTNFEPPKGSNLAAILDQLANRNPSKRESYSDDERIPVYRNRTLIIDDESSIDSPIDDENEENKVEESSEDELEQHEHVEDEEQPEEEEDMDMDEDHDGDDEKTIDEDTMLESFNRMPDDFAVLQEQVREFMAHRNIPIADDDIDIDRSDADETELSLPNIDELPSELSDELIDDQKSSPISASAMANDPTAFVHDYVRRDDLLQSMNHMLSHLTTNTPFVTPARPLNESEEQKEIRSAARDSDDSDTFDIIQFKSSAKGISMAKERKRRRKVMKRLIGNDTITKIQARNNNNGGSPLKMIDFKCLSRVITCNKAIKLIDFSNCALNNQHLQLISNGLRYNKSVRHLMLTKNGVTSEGAKYLGYVLQFNNCLRALWLRNNAIGNDGLKYIAQGLAYNSCLQTLSIDNNGITTNTQSIVNSHKWILKDHALMKLRAIDEFIGFIDISPNGTELTTFEESYITKLKVWKAKRRNRKYNIPFTVLNEMSQMITKNELYIDGILALAYVLTLRNSKRLTVLSLRNNAIGDLGAKLIATSMCDNYGLTQLHMTENKITNSGAFHLAQILHSEAESVKRELRNAEYFSDNYGKLEVYIRSGNDITDEGVIVSTDEEINRVDGCGPQSRDYNKGCLF